MNIWIADIKGKPGECFEISVLRKNNKHGKNSFGWHGDDKLYIASSVNPTHEKISPFIWSRLVQLAHDTAKYLNEEEAQKVITE